MANQSTIDYLSSLSAGKSKREYISLPELNIFKSTELPFGLKRENAFDIKDLMYFIEHPYSDVPGYYAEDTVFIVKGFPDLSGEDLGAFDADTLYFPIENIYDNDATIVYNDETFTIKDYIEKSSGSDRIGVRFVGIDSPETNKYKTIDIKSADKQIVSISVNEIYSSDTYLFDVSTINDDTEFVKFIPVVIDGIKKYCQITDYVDDDGVKKYKYLYKVADPVSNEHGRMILNALKELISGKEVVMMLDHTALNANGNDYPTTYEEVENGTLFDEISIALQSLKPENHGPYYSGFSGYGQDAYNRFLGCLYVKTKIPGLSDDINDLIGEQWINVTKYLLYYFGYPFGITSQDIPLSFGTDPNSESMFNYISSAFKLWTYDRKDHVVVDLLDNISNESISRQRQLQKDILGFDFDTQLKDWTVMIGDCVFMVPPTSIRCVTRNNAESVPLIRSRGSAIKELPQSERIIEMTLYFNDEEGINGVEVESEFDRYDEYTLKPTGDKIKYHMNGLRSLISMFKLCPFMPITNTYVNDTLNIDAVALSALTVATMPNYPKCIAATIQLMEFNYHVYMSELPLTGDESAETIIHTNLFEKCIDFDTLRYYYQKPLYRGDVAAQYPFDSQKYLELTYGSKTALQPMTNFGDSSIEFYFPDRDHLNRLLQAKIEAMNNPLKTQYSVTDDVKEWAYELGKLYIPLRNYVQSDEYHELIDFLSNGPVDINGNYILNTISSYSTIPTRYIYGYNAFCNLFNSEGRNDAVKHKYQLTKNNEFLKKYYHNPVFNATSGFQSISWKSGDGFNNIYYAPFDFHAMLFDSIYSYLSEHVYTLNKYDKYYKNVSCSVAFNIAQSLVTNKDNIYNFAKINSIILDENHSYWIDDNGNLLLNAEMTVDNGSITNINIESSSVYRLAKLCYDLYTKYGKDEDGNILAFGLPSDVMQDNVLADKQSVDVDSISTFKFEKYPNDTMLQSLIVTNISSSINNNLSRIYLKSMDGYAPQYLGGQDTVIEIAMVTEDAAAASAINLLPKLCAEYMRTYHLILPCCPLRVNTQFTRLLGVNEVLVETVDVSTVNNQPGLYQINMRLVSMDRTVRNKEALKNIDVNNAGSRITPGVQSYTVRDYFDVRNKIAAAEIYPDLELPTLAELELNGFDFIRYKIFDSGRVYPDPDFYFVYGATTANQVIRDTILTNLNKNTAPSNTFKYSDYLGGELSIDIVTDGSSSSPSQFTETKDSKNLTALIEEEAVKKAEEEIRLYEIYKKHLDVQNKHVYTASIGDTQTVDLNFSDYNNLVSFLNNLNSSYEYWNFSSDIKGLLREPQYINEDPSVYKDYIDPAIKCCTYLLSGHHDNSDYDYGNIHTYSAFKIDSISDLLTKSIDFINTEYRENINGYALTDRRLADIKDLITNNCSILQLYDIMYSIADAYTAANFYKDQDNKNKTFWKFNCFRGSDGSPIPISNSLSDEISININDATSYSAFAIREYSGQYILTHFGDLYRKHFDYIINVDSLYLDKNYFLNPDIMRHQHNIYSYEIDKSISPTRYNSSKSIETQYKYALLYDYETMFNEAVLCFILYYVSLIYNGVLISNYQLCSDLFTSSDLLEQFLDKIDIDESSPAMAAINGIFNATSSDNTTNDKPDVNISEESEVIDTVVNNSKKTAEDLVKQIQGSREKINVGNFVITALVYINGFDSDLYDLILRREYSQLNDLLVTSTLPITSTQNALSYKFLLSLAGREVIDSIEDIGSSEYTVADFASNIYNEYANIEAEHDPYTYTRDSFYDMITSDMRGRMARAFPTFYLLFVDEGREIGWWKLNDNFYNMSSINEITVTKSRKIAADTCTISMTNMFKTFTTDDEDTKEMSYDLETLSSFETSFRDVWDSIFSPRKLFLREYQERLEQNPIDRAQLKPGVRVHVRMGYGGDAYTLPCVFNGVVTEVSTGEVVNIICQGDGVELTNPIIEDMSTSDDIENYESTNFLWIRDIKNILSRGATPKTILTKFLTAKGHGFIEKVVRNYSQGRFFDDNPFGIAHFGDPDFDNIWGNSECAQNIYEAMSTPAFNDSDSYLTRIQSKYSLKNAPKVSTQILGKSYWDIMHVMASISPDYVASIAPFGMRSTVFYGLPHYYYSYEYDKVADKYVDDSGVTYVSPQIIEKRKPFQQYHIYTSYGDIIENNISASSKYMKTNATGIYYQNGAFSNTSTKKVGPLFADIDIYPEYQKAMTVDTSFIAQGVQIPIVGDIVPYLNSLTTDLGWFGNEEEKVAWRITARALKDAVKEMYQGELITIGDLSVKPYDIAYITDIYENMGGGCEVEAVTHILSSQTGFTTSIYVDPMVDIDNRYYQTAHTLTFDTVKNTLCTYSATFITSLLLSRNTQPFTKLATKAMSNVANGASDTISNIIKFIPVDDAYSQKAVDYIQGWNILGNTDIQARYKQLESELARFVKHKVDIDKLSFSSINDYNDVLEQIAELQRINTSSLSQYLNDADQMEKLIEKTRYGKNNSTVIDGIKDSINSISKSKNDSINNQLKNIIDAVTDIPDISKDDDAIIVNALKTLKEPIDINNVNKHTDAIKAILTKVTPDNIPQSVTDSMKVSVKAINGVADNAAKALTKSDDIVDALRAMTYAARGAHPVILIVTTLAEILVEAIITGTVNNHISRWLRNLETLRIYPLTKNGKVFTAGLNGSKGIVVGSSTYDQQGWIQNTITSIFDDHPVGTKIASLFFDVSAFQTIVDSWKNNNGMANSDENIENVSYSYNDLLSSLVDATSSPDLALKNSIILDRIKTLDGSESDLSDEDIKNATSAFISLAVSQESLVYSNSPVLDFVPLRDLRMSLNSLLPEYLRSKNNLVSFYHETSAYSEGYIQVNNHGNIINIPYYHPQSESNGEYIDIPIVCEDIQNVLYMVMSSIKTEYPDFNNENSDPIRLHIVNALIPDYTDSWLCTGYACKFYISNLSDDKIVNAFNSVNSALNNIFVLIDNGSSVNDQTLYELIVYPPVNNSVVSNKYLS